MKQHDKPRTLEVGRYNWAHDTCWLVANHENREEQVDQITARKGVMGQTLSRKLYRAGIRHN